MNLVLGLTQENSIENSVQDCLPFIPKLHGLCPTLNSHIFALRPIDVSPVI